MILFAMMAFVAASFYGCKTSCTCKTITGDGTVRDPQVLLDMLVRPDAWQLYQAYSTPAYHHSVDLMNGSYLYDYEMDDLIIFKRNGTQIIDPGALMDVYGHGYHELESSHWYFDSELLGGINLQIPFFYTQQTEYCHILHLDEDELQLQCRFVEGTENPVEYTFVLTYKPVFFDDNVKAEQINTEIVETWGSCEQLNEFSMMEESNGWKTVLSYCNE